MILPDAFTITPKEKEAFVYDCFQNISETYDKTNDVISFGIHRFWKDAMIKRIVAFAPKDILDVASGTGDVALWIAEKNPQAHVVGSDFSENMLVVAEKRRAEQKLDNVSFQCENAMEMSFEDNSFDVVVVSLALRNMPDYRQVVSEMTRVLRPGGQFFCIDTSWPTNPIVKPFFGLYFSHIMPLLGNAVAHAPVEYQWLNASTKAFLSKDALADLMRSCGLVNVNYKSHMLGGAATHNGTKPI
ncbi:MAG: ubiquinone/menaquinone biosynthesis methyltransferase [Coriobacteriia bacterium]|nr:ubiquinone/menaquinone biosynthesis methyltransferase [Coriobacteriia bacterium]